MFLFIKQTTLVLTNNGYRQLGTLPYLTVRNFKQTLFETLPATIDYSHLVHSFVAIPTASSLCLGIFFLMGCLAPLERFLSPYYLLTATF